MSVVDRGAVAPGDADAVRARRDESRAGRRDSRARPAPRRSSSRVAEHARRRGDRSVTRAPIEPRQDRSASASSSTGVVAGAAVRQQLGGQPRLADQRPRSMRASSMLPAHSDHDTSAVGRRGQLIDATRRRRAKDACTESHRPSRGSALDRRPRSCELVAELLDGRDARRPAPAASRAAGGRGRRRCACRRCTGSPTRR